MATDLEYRVRIRNAANSADTLVITSTRGGTNPYITGTNGIPNVSGDAQKINPRTSESYFGVYSVRFADVDIGSSQRLLTSILEDANQRQQLGYRVAFIEYRENAGSWQVLIAGPITGLRLVSDIEWEITVSDPMQAQTVKRLFTASDDTLITDFLDDWPIRGCLLGGPVKGLTGSILKIKDLGGWQMKVEPTGFPSEYFLRPVNIYGPPTWRNPEDQESLEELARAINDAAASLQSEIISADADAWDTIEDSVRHSYAYPGLVILVDGVPFKPLIFEYDSAVDSRGAQTIFSRFFGYGYHGNRGLKIKTDGVRTLTSGALVRVRAITVLPTEICPIYIVDHPIEILKTCWAAAGIAYSSSACTTLKELIGTDARYGLRITSARAMSDIARMVCFPYGIGLRGNSSGEIEPFDARLGRSNATPSVTITDADVEKGSVHPFDYDPGSAVTLIDFSAPQWIDQRTAPMRLSVRDVASGGPFGGLQTSIVDGIVVGQSRLTVQNQESGALSFGDIQMSFEGMISGSYASWTYVRDFFIGIARRMFDRWGRGSQGATMTFLRTGSGASVKVGDEVFVDVSALPNHNYRLGDNGSIAARAMQVVQRTVVPKGLQVTLEDSGLSGQPPATLPTISIAASSDSPKTVALGTITNAAALNAANIGVRVQIAYDSTTTRFFDVVAWAPGKVPTTAFRLPPVVSANTVYMRARSEKPGSRASNWSSAVNVSLSGWNAPTSVVATPNGSDGGKCDLTWAMGSGSEAMNTDVFLRLNGETFDQAVRIATLEAGSTRYEISGLATGTDYIASVQHRNPNTQDITAAVDASFTTVGTTVTLSAPSDPCPFASSPSVPRLAADFSAKKGLYGIGVVAAHYPGEIEVYVAVETSVGAGTYGSYALAGTIPSVSGNWTLWQGIAPNDGLRRKLKARHVRRGTTASAYCAEVVATPWSTYQPLPPYPGDALLEIAVTPISPSADGRLAFRLVPRDPFASGSADLDLDFDIESGLTVYEYGTTTPAAAVSVASLSNNDYEAVRPLPGDGAKIVSALITKTGRTTGKSAPIVVPEIGSDSGTPAIGSLAVTGYDDPGDGSGYFDISFGASNVPSAGVFELKWTISGGSVYNGSTGTVSGFTSPQRIGDTGGIGGAVPLTTGDTLQLVLTLKLTGIVVATRILEQAIT